MCESQKHLGVILDKHLNFHEHIDKKNKICNKMIGTISVHLRENPYLESIIFCSITL